MTFRTRPLLWVLPALLVAIVVWFSTGQPTREDRGDEPAPRAAEPAAARPDPELQVEARESLERSDSNALAGSSIRTELPVAVQAAQADGAPAFLEGEVLALDIRGQQLEPQDGEVTFQLLGPGDSTGKWTTLDVVAEVEAGRFRQAVELPADQLAQFDHYLFMRALLGGRPASPAIAMNGDAMRSPPFRPGESLRFCLVLMPEHFIEVFAAESGAPLAEAYALPSARGSDQGPHLLWPPPEPVACPLPLPISAKGLTDATARVLVGAPGRVWQAIEVDVTTAGSTRVELERGSGLEVSWAGPEAAAKLLLQPTGSKTLKLDLQRGGLPLRLEGLPAGAVRVLGVIEEDGKDEEAGPRILATAQAVLVAGETTKIALLEDQGAGLGLTHVAGRIRIAQEWQVQRLTLSGSSEDHLVGSLNSGHTPWLLSDLELVREGDWLVGDFRFEGVPAGKFVLRCPTIFHSRELQVPPQGLLGLDLEVGPPSTLRLSFVDSASGEPVSPERCSCNDASVPVAGGQETGVLELRLPSEAVHFSATFPRHMYVWTTLEVPPGGKELVLPVDRCPMVSVTLPTGSSITFSGGRGHWLPRQPRLVPASPDAGQVIRSELGGSSARFMVSRPGRYRLHLPLYAEFQAVDPIEFHLGPGEELKPAIQWIPS